MQMIMNKEFAEKHGISKLSDIAANKVPVRVLLNKRGNVASQAARQCWMPLVPALQTSNPGVEMLLCSLQGTRELMRDRRADVLLNCFSSITVRSASLQNRWMWFLSISTVMQQPL